MKVSLGEKKIEMGEKDVALVGREDGSVEIFLPESKAIGEVPLYLKFVAGCGTLCVDPDFVKFVCRLVEERVSEFQRERENITLH